MYGMYRDAGLSLRRRLVQFPVATRCRLRSSVTWTRCAASQFSEDFDLAGRRGTQRERRLLDVLARLFGSGAVDHQLEKLPFLFGAIQTAQCGEQALPLLALTRL